MDTARALNYRHVIICRLRIFIVIFLKMLTRVVCESSSCQHRLEKFVSVQNMSYLELWRDCLGAPNYQSCDAEHFPMLPARSSDPKDFPTGTASAKSKNALDPSDEKKDPPLDPEPTLNASSGTTSASTTRQLQSFLPESLVRATLAPPRQIPSLLPPGPTPATRSTSSQGSMVLKPPPSKSVLEQDPGRVFSPSPPLRRTTYLDFKRDDANRTGQHACPEHSSDDKSSDTGLGTNETYKLQKRRPKSSSFNADTLSFASYYVLVCVTIYLLKDSLWGVMSSPINWSGDVVYDLLTALEEFAPVVLKMWLFLVTLEVLKCVTKWGVCVNCPVHCSK